MLAFQRAPTRDKTTGGATGAEKKGRPGDIKVQSTGWLEVCTHPQPLLSPPPPPPFPRAGILYTKLGNPVSTLVSPARL